MDLAQATEQLRHYRPHAGLQQVADSFYGELLHIATTLCGTSMGALHLVGPSQQELTLRAATALPPIWQEWIETVPIRSGIGAGVFGLAAVRQDVVVAPSPKHPAWEGFRLVGGAVGLRSAAAVPLILAKGPLFGTLSVFYSDETQPSAAQIRHLQHIVRVALQIIETHTHLLKQCGSTGRGAQGPQFAGPFVRQTNFVSTRHHTG